MLNLLKESFIYKFYIWINNGIKSLFEKSAIISGFFKEKDQTEKQNNSIIVRLINKIISILRFIFSKLKLNTLLEGSIFTKPQIWITFVLVLSPFLPTMMVLGLVLFTTVTLVLKACVEDDFELVHFKTNSWVLAFVAVVAFSAFASLAMQEAIKIAMLSISFILFYFVWINTVKTKEQMKFYISMFILAGVLAALYGLYQYFFGDIYSQAWLDDEMFEDIKMRVYSTFQNPNVFGEYLLLVIPFSVMFIADAKKILQKLFWLGCSLVLILSLVLTFSRGCWLGLIISSFILAILFDKRLIWLGVIALLAAPFILPQTILERFASIGNMQDTSTSYRVYIWLGTIAMLKDYFFCGIGLGTTSFNTIYPLYSYNEIVAPHSHSLYLQLFVEYGLVGFIVFCGIIYNFFKETMIHYKNTRNYFTMASIAALAGFLLQSATDYTWYNYRLVLIFWIVIAIGISNTKIKYENIKEKND